MRLCIILVASALALIAADNQLSPKELSGGWVLLFDGTTLNGWTSEGGTQWKVAEGRIIADAGEYGWLRSNAEFGDFELSLEFRTAADGNSGVFLRSAATGQPHLTGYELQIYDKHEKFSTGSLVGVAIAQGGAIRAGEWQLFEVMAKGPQFIVKLDGKTVLETGDGKSSSGHIGLQYNKGKTIEFRNIKVHSAAPRAK